MNFTWIYLKRDRQITLLESISKFCQLLCKAPTTQTENWSKIKQLHTVYYHSQKIFFPTNTLKQGRGWGNSLKWKERQWAWKERNYQNLIHSQLLLIILHQRRNNKTNLYHNTNNNSSISNHSEHFSYNNNSHIFLTTGSLILNLLQKYVHVQYVYI